MKRSLSLLLILSLSFLQGCYSHTPVSVANVPVGAPVRARVSAAKAEELAPILGRESRLLSGRALEVGADGLMLQVRAASPTTSQPLAQRIHLTPTEILEIEVRELNRRVTIGVVLGAVALGAVAVLALFGGSDPTEASGPDKPGGDDARAPVPSR